MTDTAPFACNMNALSPEQRVRHRQLGNQLRSTLITFRELPDGYEFEFPLDLHDALTELTPLERACCPLFTISIRVEQSRLFWRLAGREGVKPFIRMEFAEWFR
jgi:hypothetical protein